MIERASLYGPGERGVGAVPTAPPESERIGA
jgi:hypothetical protein